MIEVSVNKLIFVHVRFFLNRIIVHQAHHRLDLMPQVFRGILGLGQKTRHLIMADLAIQQRR